MQVHLGFHHGVVRMSKLVPPAESDENGRRHSFQRIPGHYSKCSVSSGDELGSHEVIYSFEDDTSNLGFFAQVSQKAEMLFLEFIAIIILLIVIPLALVITHRRYIMKSIGYTLA